MPDKEEREIIIISEPISAERIAKIAADTFGDMVKAVVDVKLRLLAFGGGMRMKRPH